MSEPLILVKQPSLALLGLALSLGVTNSAGPSALEISANRPRSDERAQCPDCTIKVEELVHLGAGVGPGAFPGGLNDVVVDRTGQYWAVFRDVVFVYASDGSFIRSVGRRGSGPGEFAYATHAIVVPHDSVVIFDQIAARATVIAPDFTVARMIDLPRLRLWDVVPAAWPSGVFVNGMLSTPRSAGWPLHVLDMSGREATTVHSFGPNDGVYRQGQDVQLMQKLARAPDSHVFAADVVRFTIRAWTPGGELISVLQRTPDWFTLTRSLTFYGIGNRTAQPDPRMATIGVQDDGRIWAVAHVARPDWRQAWVGKPDIPQGIGSISVSALPSSSDLYRTRIEVIDGDELIAGTWIESLIVAWLPDNRLAGIPSDGDGLVIFRAIVLESGIDGLRFGLK